MITLVAAASHSVIPTTFSGNSLAAEILLQISLVSLFSINVFRNIKEMGNRRESKECREGKGYYYY